MSIQTTTTLNPSEIAIGSQVLYVCPWTGFDTLGEVVAENADFGEGFFDIRPDKQTIENEVDTAIHLTDIRPTDSE